MDKSLAGKTVLITGANGGLGYKTANIFADKGANLILFDIAPSVNNLFKGLKERVLTYCGDILSVSDLTNAVNLGVEKFGGIHFLVCCAGIFTTGSVSNISEKDWNRIIDVNLTGVFFSCKTVLPVMLKQKYGRIVTVSSIFGQVASYKMAAYCAAKAGVIQLTRSIALDYVYQNIRANCICPSIIRTKLIGENYDNLLNNQELIKLFSNLPQTILDTESVAKSILFLSTDEINGLNGTILNIDGGYTAR